MHHSRKAIFVEYKNKEIALYIWYPTFEHMIVFMLEECSYAYEYLSYASPFYQDAQHLVEGTSQIDRTQILTHQPLLQQHKQLKYRTICIVPITIC